MSASSDESDRLKAQRAGLNALLKSKTVDLNKLRAASRAHGQFVDSALRSKIWPKLLSLNRSIDLDMDEGTITTNKRDDVMTQVDRDVERSLSNIDELKNHSEKEIQEKREVLKQMIMRFFCNNPSFHYFQGYHDVVCTIYLTLEKEESDVDAIDQVVQAISTKYFVDCHRSDFYIMAKTIPVVLTIIEKADPNGLHKFLSDAEMLPFFSTSWILTWFAHEIKNVKEVARIFDVLLSSPPPYILYVCAAFLLHHKELIMKQECEFPLIHDFLSRGLANGILPFEIEHISKKADDLFEAIPLSEILNTNFTLQKLVRCGKIDLFENKRNANENGIAQNGQHNTFKKVLSLLKVRKSHLWSIFYELSSLFGFAYDEEELQSVSFYKGPKRTAVFYFVIGIVGGLLKWKMHK